MVWGFCGSFSNVSFGSRAFSSVFGALEASNVRNGRDDRDAGIFYDDLKNHSDILRLL